MLLETKRVEKMQEKMKMLMAAMKMPAPEQVFLRQINANVRQVKNQQLRGVAGKYTVNIDRPLEQGGDETGPDPEEVLLIALGACTEMNWVAYSSAFNLDIREAVVDVEGTIDRRFMVNGANSVPARLKTVKIISRVVTSAPREKVEIIHQKVQQFCPVSGSLHPDIKKEYSLEIQPPKD